MSDKTKDQDENAVDHDAYMKQKQREKVEHEVIALRKKEKRDEEAHDRNSKSEYVKMGLGIGTFLLGVATIFLKSKK